MIYKNEWSKSNMKQLPEELIQSLIFCTKREAQALVDKRYTGWKVKIGKGNVGLIYDPSGKLAHKIQPQRDKKMNKIMDSLERKFL